MYLPTINGIIERRILLNFVVEKEVMNDYLPKPFTPRLYKNKAIVGICLIRLKHIRPYGFPKFIGFGSENAAHRIAVEWRQNGKLNHGVYIPRRDSSSLLNAFAGGRFFPGIHHYANFSILENESIYNIKLDGADGTKVSVQARETMAWNSNSIFETLESASDFFEGGSLGYSPTGQIGKFDGIELRTFNWKVSPLEVSEVHSSFFEDTSIFPKGSVNFDHGLLMKNIEHEWKSILPCLQSSSSC